MKAVLFSSTAGGLENNLQLSLTASSPSSSLKHDQVTIEVISASLNPRDFKIAELPVVGRLAQPMPASPAIDYCGRVVSAGNDLTSVLKPGQLVFGRLDGAPKFGTLGQFITANRSGAVPLPHGVDPDHGAAVGTAGLTAYQCVVPNSKRGDRIFIHGGSGGTGTFGIQFGKANGCHVTTTCSTGNVQMCKNLGADEVIDYKTSNVIDTLKTKGPGYFSLVVDNVGTPNDLYYASNDFVAENGKYVQVGASVALGAVGSLLSRFFWPAALGGGKRQFEFLGVKSKAEDLSQIAEWMSQGKVKAVIDSTFELEDAAKAYERLRTNRARGKIIVHVTEKS
ncbi:MAG: hypothetical protein M1822_002131 [Bathelium mastoideum]|nr:MAG: hypothetical protein M1822_002131 [Bathelium mastoideum]